MSLMKEYVDKKLSTMDYEAELKRLIDRYNKKRKTYLVVYSGSTAKRQIPDVALCMDDYYVIYDLLRTVDVKDIDFYIETGGGSGEAAEEIVRFIRSKFDNIVFVVSGEAKSAGTLIVMSGNEIIMTKSGSLGPIDAQVRIGRSVISAEDYILWVDEKREEANKHSKLNPFDALMVAQISPGEIKMVRDSLEFAKDLFKDWLPRYKFKDWNHTETRNVLVTDEMKEIRADQIAEALQKRTKWRSHGRSIKIEDLEEIKLKITRADDDAELADIIYRIQTILRLLYSTSSTYKVFATIDGIVTKHATLMDRPAQLPKKGNVKNADAVEIEILCDRCGNKHLRYIKFKADPNIDQAYLAKNIAQIPVNKKLMCDCGNEIDLSGVINQIETEANKKTILK